MWGRIVEFMVAVWLIFSPFIFAASDNAAVLWGDMATAALICLLSGVSYWYPLRHVHFANLLVAVGLVLVGRFATPPPAIAAQQNHITVGFFLMMIALIPNSASLPPVGWCREVSSLDDLKIQ